MTVGLFELANLLSTLVVGRNPGWYDQVDALGAFDYAGAPNAGSDGVPLDNAPTALLIVDLRDDVSYRTCRITLGVFVAGQVWTVTVGGNPVATGAIATNWSDVVDALIAALPGVPAADALVTFTRSGTGDATILLVEGKAEPGYSIGIAAGGGASMACVANPESLDVRLFFTHLGSAANSTRNAPAANTWRQANGAVYVGVTYRGCVERVTVAGLARGYAQLANLAGVVGDGGTVTYDVAYLGWGPALQET